MGDKDKSGAPKGPWSPAGTKDSKTKGHGAVGATAAGGGENVGPTSSSDSSSATATVPDAEAVAASLSEVDDDVFIEDEVDLSSYVALIPTDARNFGQFGSVDEDDEDDEFVRSPFAQYFFR
jgi:hypothetical protein